MDSPQSRRDRRAVLSDLRSSAVTLFSFLFSLFSLVEGRSNHDVADEQPRRSMRDAVGLRGLPFGVAAGAVHLVLAREAVEVGPEIGGDRVVGHVGDGACDLTVFDLPENVA